MTACMTLSKNIRLPIKTCRELLDIQSRSTMNEYLKILRLADREVLMWDEVKQLVELQSYLGLKPGQNSKHGFCDRSPIELAEDFASHGVSIDERLAIVQSKYHKQLRLEVNSNG